MQTWGSMSLDHSMLPSQGAPSWETPHRQLAVCWLSVQACCHWRWVLSVHTRGWDRGDWSKVLYVNRTGAQRGWHASLVCSLSDVLWTCDFGLALGVQYALSRATRLRLSAMLPCTGTALSRFYEGALTEGCGQLGAEPSRVETANATHRPKAAHE